VTKRSRSNPNAATKHPFWSGKRKVVRRTRFERRPTGNVVKKGSALKPGVLVQTERLPRNHGCPGGDRGGAKGGPRFRSLLDQLTQTLGRLWPENRHRQSRRGGNPSMKRIKRAETTAKRLCHKFRKRKANDGA